MQSGWPTHLSVAEMGAAVARTIDALTLRAAREEDAHFPLTRIGRTTRRLPLRDGGLRKVARATRFTSARTEAKNLEDLLLVSTAQ